MSGSDVSEPEEQSVDQPAGPPSEDPSTGSAPAESPRPRWWRRHRIVTAVLGTVLLGALILGGANLWVRASASGHLYTVASAPSAPAALVLGAGLRPDGTPSPYLAARLDDAAELFRLGKVKALLVSGDNGSTSHDEPNAMRDYLIAHGVPADKVVRDYAGFDTWDSCVRAKQIFGASRLLVVSQEFHLPRAVFLCRRAGIDADGVANPYHATIQLAPQLREIPAAVKAAWDGIWQPSPTFLGPYESALDVAVNGGL